MTTTIPLNPLSYHHLQSYFISMINQCSIRGIMMIITHFLLRRNDSHLEIYRKTRFPLPFRSFVRIFSHINNEQSNESKDSDNIGRHRGLDVVEKIQCSAIGKSGI